MEKKYFVEPNGSGVFVGMDKRARIDSRTVAEVFGENHFNIMGAIETLDCSDYFKGLNFELSEYEENGKSCWCYTMTREGFTRLVQKYNKEKYAEIRKEFFRRFNEMEAIVNEKLAEKYT